MTAPLLLRDGANTGRLPLGSPIEAVFVEAALDEEERHALAEEMKRAVAPTTAAAPAVAPNVREIAIGGRARELHERLSAPRTMVSICPSPARLGNRR